MKNLKFNMEEIWKDIDWIETKYQYQVSNLGNFRRRLYGIRRTSDWKILKGTPDRKGYIIVKLTTNSYESVTQKLHRLVATAFIPNINNYPQVNHKDENKSNNNVNNLEWCTNEYNHNYGTHNERVGLKNKGKKRSAESIERYKIANKLSKVGKFPHILQFTKDGLLIKEWEFAKDIERALGFGPKEILNCCKGVLKTSHGFIWKYKKDI